MLTKAEKAILSPDFKFLRELWIFRARVESKRIHDGAAAMQERGFEQVQVDDVAIVTADGREVLRAFDRAWALNMDIHNARLAMAFKEEAQSLQEQGKPGEALTSVLCPACKAVMAKSPVCPNCAKGKEGFKILCQCTECGHEVYL